MLRLFAILNARLVHQRGRTLLSVAGIALGVALGFGVQLVNRAAVDELGAAVRRAAGEADLQVRGGRSGFPDELYARVARLPGIALAAPALELEVGVAASEHRLRVTGVDALRAVRLNPALVAEDPARLAALLAPDTIFVSSAAAQALALERGARLALIVGQRRVEFEVAGVLSSSILPGHAALLDIATAQWRLQRVGELNRIDLRLAPGIDAAQLSARIVALLPPGTHLSSVAAAEEASADPSRAYRVNLEVLALVALFTGGFLVFSAQTLEVARRRGEHALLRVLGLERRGVLRLVLVEAGALGAAGGVLGVALGHLFAGLALRYAGGDLGAGMFRGIAPQIAFEPAVAALYVAIGIGVALVGAALPAREAAATPAARALKAGDTQRLFGSAASPWPGVALLGLGAVLTLPGPVDGVALFGYLAIACVLLGSIALMPWLVRGLLERLPLPRSAVGILALEQLRGAPGQAMVSLAAIVASFSLMVAMAIMVASFRESVADWLDAVLPADLYFRSSHAGETAYLEPGFVRALHALPDVARVDFLRSGRLILDAAHPAVSLIARDLPLGDASRVFPIVGERYARRADDPPPVWVSEAMRELYGYQPGRRVEVPLAGARRAFVVAGVWRDYARQHGALLIDRADYIALTGDTRVNDGSLWLVPGASLARTMDRLRGLPGGEYLEIASPGEIRGHSLAIFDRSFAVTYAIEAVAVLVGLFGLSSSLGAIVLARRREFGVLRHLGMTRARIGAMLAAEGSLLAALGAAAGLATGAAISLILIEVVDRQSFNWSMDLHVPWATLAALTAVLVLLAALTAWLSGREAMGAGPVRAVREDW